MRIALCDDETAQLALADTLLREYCLLHPELNLRVFPFTSGAALLEHLRTGEPFDIYILDVIMPGENGIELGLKLREIDRGGRIIYLSTSSDFAVDSYLPKASSYLLKPVSQDLLFRTLDAILSSYFRRAKDLGIQVKTQLAIPEELPVPVAELSTVFANALENMIHEVQKLPPDERCMVCKCITSPRLMIEFSNPCTEDVTIGADGLPVTRDTGHGIGTRSIMAFAEKHRAVCSFRAENGWFKLQMAL